MKITRIQTFIVHGCHDNWVITRVYTDEGITGVGESSLEGRENAVKEAIKSLESYLIGKDPFDIEKHYYVMYRDAYWGSCALLTGALSAIDGALWDIKGKALGVPVYQLLGGKFREKVKVYANRWFFGARSAEELAEKAYQTVDKGFAALKWDPFGKAEWNISKTQLKEALKSVAAVRRAVGDDVEIMIEGHGRFDARTAITIAKELEEYKPMFFEEPIMPENIDALAEVKQHSPIPIAAGERLYTKTDFRVVLEKRAVDIIQPDLRVTGGIIETKKIAALAEASFIPVAPHNIHGQVGTAMSMAIMATIPNALILEYNVEDIPWEKEIYSRTFRPVNGYIEVSDLPGLGIEFNEETARKYPLKSMSMIEEMFNTTF